MACREQILSEDYVEILLDYLSESGDQKYPAICAEIIDDQFIIVYVHKSKYIPFGISSYTYSSIPKLYGLMQDGMILDSTISAQRNFDPINLIRPGIMELQRPPLSLTGKGVIIGFVDTGIRYESDVFRREDGSSRILSIWDQTIQEGDPPAAFSFGSEYTNEQINLALQNKNPRSIVPSVDTIGHGTAMASVAAGSNLGFGLTFTGAAPEADIVMVKCKETKQYLRDYYLIPDDVPAYAESDIGMAVKYLEGFAGADGRPLIICLGIGTNWGDHEGNSILGSYLNRIASRRKRAVVVCGGNEGNAGHHYSSFVELQVAQFREIVEIRVGAGETGFLMEMWGDAPNIFNVSIRSPGGEFIPTINFRAREKREFSFVYEKTKLIIEHVLVEKSSGEELFVFRFINPTEGVWTLYVTSEGEKNYGSLNLWLPITEFLKSETIFLRSSPYKTLTEPSLTSDVITPSTYQAANNSFYINSGRGFSRLGREKPDFAAPGVNVSTILGPQTGSCMSAAITAGGTAQFLQWAIVEENDPLVRSREIKKYFARGAVRDPNTFYPNRQWGYGRLNVARAFEIVAGTAGEGT